MKKGYRHEYVIEPADLKQLKEAARDRLLLPFVGAGLSRCLNDSFPTWNDVIGIAARHLGYDARILTAVANYYEIGEMLRRDDHKWARFVAELKDTLDNEALATIGNDTPHHWLARMDTRAIYTTNWDSWIERALKLQKRDFRLINSVSRLHEKVKALDVIKFHGDLNAPESLIFGEAGYHDRMRFEHPFDVLLKAHCLQTSVLFLGYSFSDMNIRLLWSRLWESFEKKKATCRAYLCVVGNPAIVRDCIAAKGISVIGLSPLDASRSLTQLMRTIVQAQA